MARVWIRILRDWTGPPIAFALAGGVEVDSRENEGQLRGRGLDRDGVLVDPGHLERADFEPLVNDGQPVSIPPEDLHAITSAVEEEKEVTGERVLAEGFGDEAAEPVEPLAEIDGLSVEKDAYEPWKARHGPPRPAVATN